MERAIPSEPGNAPERLSCHVMQHGGLWDTVPCWGGPSGAHALVTCVLIIFFSWAPKAKTTKKIVLRMQCSDCKQTCMKGLKVWWDGGRCRKGRRS